MRCSDANMLFSEKKIMRSFSVRKDRFNKFMVLLISAYMAAIFWYLFSNVSPDQMAAKNWQERIAFGSLFPASFAWLYFLAVSFDQGCRRNWIYPLEPVFQALGLILSILGGIFQIVWTIAKTIYGCGRWILDWTLFLPVGYLYDRAEHSDFYMLWAVAMLFYMIGYLFVLLHAAIFLANLF
jgi:hypothetical protein